MLDVGTAPSKSDSSAQPTPATPLHSATRASRRILFLGTHGQSNIGDELLLTTFLQQLGDHHRYVVNSYDPERTRSQLQPQFDVEVIATSGDRWPLLRELVGCDAVVFGGGSIIKELYRSVGRWRYATLVMVLGLVLVARVARRPVLLCGVGVGPLDTRFGRLLAAVIVRSASLVSVRDDASYQTCLDVGVRPGRVVRIPDPAFVNRADQLLPGTPPIDLPTDVRSNGRVRIALNLNRDIANGERWDDVLAELAQTFDLVAERNPIEVHALPMQSEFKEHDDAVVLREFLADRPQWRPVLHDTADHRDIAAILANCDVVVSARLHAIVIASILGRPTIGLLYDVKVAELADQLGIGDRSVDINAPFDPAVLASSVIAVADMGMDEGGRLCMHAEACRIDLDDHFHQVRAWLHDPAGFRAWQQTADQARRST
jgi:polysaccharide pyruvyl transferase WcaK-like protein